jgi:hypothetical protein
VPPGGTQAPGGTGDRTDGTDDRAGDDRAGDGR